MESRARGVFVVLGVLFMALGSVPAAWGAGLDPRILAIPTVQGLHRMGLIVVGEQDAPRARAAAALVRASLEGAGHKVIALAGAPTVPTPALVVNYCATSDLDAVALVKVSTAVDGWKADVELRNTRGRLVSLGGTRWVPNDHPTMGGARPWEMVPETSTTISGRDPTPDEDAELRRAQEESLDQQPRAPRLRVDSDKLTLLGVAPVGHDEFYEIVGRPDLASSYRSRSELIKAGKAVGWVTIGAAIASAAVLLVADVFVAGVCAVPNEVQKDNGQPQTCQSGGGELFLIPAAIGVGGTAMLIGMARVPRDPLTFEQRQALAHQYNARLDEAAGGRVEPPRASGWLHDLAVAGAPLPNGDGGALFLSGRF
jgi:hypothetical protein